MSDVSPSLVCPTTNIYYSLVRFLNNSGESGLPSGATEKDEVGCPSPWSCFLHYAQSGHMDICELMYVEEGR